MKLNSAGASGSTNRQRASVYKVHYLLLVAGSLDERASVDRRLFVPLETLADKAELSQQVVASGFGTKQAVAGQRADE